MPDPLLVIESLTLKFPTGMSVGPVDGALSAGVYHLQGGNGCGKTSLMRAISGSLRPSSGRCLVKGEDIWRDARSRRHLGYVPAHPEQPEFLTIRECWQFYAALRQQAQWDGAELTDRLGLDPNMSLAHASAGQRRRAELLAGLAGDPAVLLLDEVFAYLDVDSCAVLVSLIESFRADRVILITAHHDLPFEVDACWTMEPKQSLSLDVS